MNKVEKQQSSAHAHRVGLKLGLKLRLKAKLTQELNKTAEAVELFRCNLEVWKPSKDGKNSRMRARA